MAEVATDGLLVLHAIRVKGFVDEEGISSVTGLDRSDIDGSLRCHSDAGWVAHRDGRFAGWSLTPAGREDVYKRQVMWIERKWTIRLPRRP